jgi:hypothetical protein
MGIGLSTAKSDSAALACCLRRITTMKHSATLTCILLVGGVGLGGARPASAQTASEVIARARTYLGGNAALDAVNSVHFRGVLEPGNITPAGTKPEQLAVEIIFQKPYQQRIVISGSESTETTALDGATGWEEGREGPGRGQIKVLRPDQIRQLQANTWENLNFYKGIEQRGGSVAVLGNAVLDGRPAVKLAFTHDTGIVYVHYFDRESGKLLLTETEQGMSVREEGELFAGGVRFPRRVIQTTKGLDSHGQPVEQRLVLSFDTVTLNETFPESDFDLPLAIPSSPEPAAPAKPAPAVKSANPPPDPGPAGK